MLGYHTPRSRHPPGPDTPPGPDNPPGADTPRSRHPPEQTPPEQTHHPTEQTHPQEQTPPQQMATAADGTHPTGMHSCSNKKNTFNIGSDNGQGLKNVVCKQILTSSTNMWGPRLPLKGHNGFGLEFQEILSLDWVRRHSVNVTFM